MRGKIRLSYVEVVIMAVALGVAAKAIGPRIMQARAETKISALIEGLEAMRANLDLYRAKHGHRLPPVDSFESFEAAMTTKAGQHGPYIKKMPTNPFNKLKTVRFDGEPAGAGRAGWRFDTKTGLFQADSEGYTAL